MCTHSMCPSIKGLRLCGSHAVMLFGLRLGHGQESGVQAGSALAIALKGLMKAAQVHNVNWKQGWQQH